MHYQSLGIVCLMYVLLAASVANAQPPSETDRVIAGLDNLSGLAKGAEIKDEKLKMILMNQRLNCLVIGQVTIPPKDGKQATLEYYILHTYSKRTKFEKRIVSKEDYEELIRLADKLHRD
jgi:hypothetical protein